MNTDKIINSLLEDYHTLPSEMEDETYKGDLGYDDYIYGRNNENGDSSTLPFYLRNIIVKKLSITKRPEIPLEVAEQSHEEILEWEDLKRWEMFVQALTYQIENDINDKRNFVEKQINEIRKKSQKPDMMINNLNNRLAKNIDDIKRGAITILSMKKELIPKIRFNSEEYNKEMQIINIHQKKTPIDKEIENVRNRKMAIIDDSKRKIAMEEKERYVNFYESQLPIEARSYLRLKRMVSSSVDAVKRKAVSNLAPFMKPSVMNAFSKIEERIEEMEDKTTKMIITNKPKVKAFVNKSSKTLRDYIHYNIITADETKKAMEETKRAISEMFEKAQKGSENIDNKLLTEGVQKGIKYGIETITKHGISTLGKAAGFVIGNVVGKLLGETFDTTTSLFGKIFDAAGNLTKDATKFMINYYISGWDLAKMSYLADKQDKRKKMMEAILKSKEKYEKEREQAVKEWRNLLYNESRDSFALSFKETIIANYLKIDKNMKIVNDQMPIYYRRIYKIDSSVLEREEDRKALDVEQDELINELFSQWKIEQGYGAGGYILKDKIDPNIVVFAYGQNLRGIEYLPYY